MGTMDIDTTASSASFDALGRPIKWIRMSHFRTFVYPWNVEREARHARNLKANGYWRAPDTSNGI